MDPNLSSYPNWIQTLIVTQIAKGEAKCTIIFQIILRIIKEEQFNHYYASTNAEKQEAEIYEAWILSA